MQHVRITFCHNDEKQWFRLRKYAAIQASFYTKPKCRQGSPLAFLNPLKIHEGLRLTVKSSDHIFLVKGCLILEGVFTSSKVYEITVSQLFNLVKREDGT